MSALSGSFVEAASQPDENALRPQNAGAPSAFLTGFILY